MNRNVNTLQHTYNKQYIYIWYKTNNIYIYII